MAATVKGDSSYIATAIEALRAAEVIVGAALARLAFE